MLRVKRMEHSLLSFCIWPPFLLSVHVVHAPARCRFSTVISAKSAISCPLISDHSLQRPDMQNSDQNWKRILTPEAILSCKGFVGALCKNQQDHKQYRLVQTVQVSRTMPRLLSEIWPQLCRGLAKLLYTSLNLTQQLVGTTAYSLSCLEPVTVSTSYTSSAFAGPASQPNQNCSAYSRLPGTGSSTMLGNPYSWRYTTEYENKAYSNVSGRVQSDCCNP